MTDISIIGTFLHQLNFFNTGIILWIIMMIIGIARGLTRDGKNFTFIGSILAFTFGIILLPNEYQSGILFITGQIGLIISYYPLLKEYQEVDIWKKVLLLFFVGISLGFVTNVYMANAGQFTEASSNAAILGAVNWGITYTNASNQGVGLDNIGSGTQDNTLFQILDGMLAIGKGVVAAGKLFLIGLGSLGMMVYLTAGLIQNPVIAWLVSILLIGINFTFIINVINFLFNKRGKGYG